MEREILFRGKSIKSGQWIEGMTISKGTIERKQHKLFMEVSEGKWAGIIPETLGQYTGLTDKNGTKIFEGDIIGEKGLVNNGDMGCKKVSNIRLAVCDVNSCGTSLYINNYRSGMHHTSIEIIGNIIDNPELLNK